MEHLDEDIFEGTVEIVSAAMEENEVEINAAGGEKVAEFFISIYKKLAAFKQGDESRPGSFEVYRDGKGEFRFRLKAPNGETVATSEGYSGKASCLKGVESVQRSAPAAKVKEV